MKALVVLTPSESKRLIGKAVAHMQEVKHALKDGMIILAGGTTCAYVAEEILGKSMEKGGYASGFIVPKGLCHHTQKPKRVIIEKGRLREDLSRYKAIRMLKADDVFIKSANAIDPEGNAGILLYGVRGGSIGRAFGTIVTEGVNLIIPVGLEKLIPTSVFRISEQMGKGKIDYCMGLPVGYIPLHGTVVTEIEAMEILMGVNAIAVASGGVHGAEGAITLLLNGSEDTVQGAIQLVTSLKGEPPVEVHPSDCGSCSALDCHNHD